MSRDVKLTKAQQTVLTLLHIHGPMGITKNTGNRWVAGSTAYALERRGLVETYNGYQGHGLSGHCERRAKLTEQGEELIRDALAENHRKP